MRMKKEARVRAGGEGGVNPIGNEWGIQDSSKQENAVRKCAFLIHPPSSSGTGHSSREADQGCHNNPAKWR